MLPVNDAPNTIGGHHRARACHERWSTEHGMKQMDLNRTGESLLKEQTQASTGLRGWMEAVTSVRASCSLKTGRYYGLDDFVLQHGRDWKYQPLPDDVPAGEPRACFRNASLLALSSGQFVYCEGMAIGVVIPVHHAWCVDLDGRVIDPTWHRLRRDLSPREYFGVAIKTPYLRKVVVALGQCSGVIYLPELGCPIFTDPIREWKHELSAPSAKRSRKTSRRET